jgi:hypothetical protein
VFDPARLFENNVPGSAGVFVHQSEFAVRIGPGRQIAALHHAAKVRGRSQVLEIAAAMVQTIGLAAGEPLFGQGAAAMDATGLETTAASAHFQCRRGGQRRKWVKISTIVLCGSLLPLG